MLICGLGNPGRKYEKTRHNTGFMVLDELAARHGLKWKTAMKAKVAEGRIAGQKVILAKPQTYMNLSGESVSRLAGYYGIGAAQILAVFDDVSLPLGVIRLRRSGSAGGHNGVKSLISCLGSDGFPRVKMGVGEKPEEADLIEYVLGRFPKEERKLLKKEVEEGADAVEAVLSGGFDAAMNAFNGRRLE